MSYTKRDSRILPVLRNNLARDRCCKYYREALVQLATITSSSMTTSMCVWPCCWRIVVNDWRGKDTCMSIFAAINRILKYKNVVPNSITGASLPDHTTKLPTVSITARKKKKSKNYANLMHYASSKAPQHVSITIHGWIEMGRISIKHTFGCAPSEDSEQPAHSRSLIRLFTVRILGSQGCKVSSC